MPKKMSISINLGPNFTGLSLVAQIIRSNGNPVTSFISEGFFEIGNGFYIWEYTNFPENFQGGIKFCKNHDTSEVLYFVNFSTENIDCCKDCVSEVGDFFDITYSDQTGHVFYALLFSAEDLTKAWNPLSESFETYTLNNHSEFILLLNEDIERTGWYSYSISNTSKIPSVIGNSFYFIEIWQMKGDLPSRINDCNTGNLRVCWGSKNSEWLEIARRVWEYGTRTLTSFPEIPPGITPQQIWEYSTRTLTAGGIADCDYTELEAHILAAIALSTGKTLEELNKVNEELGSSIQKTFDLLKTCCAAKSRGSPTVQSPRIGPRGSKGRGPNMRFG